MRLDHSCRHDVIDWLGLVEGRIKFYRCLVGKLGVCNGVLGWRLESFGEF